MVAFRINVFGGMIPAQDDRLIPDGAASLAQNTWLYSGSLEGFKSPRFIRNLSNSAAKSVYRIPFDPFEDVNFNNSIWMEFTGLDVNVLRAPVRDDSYERYYWAGTGVSPSYNPKSRIASGFAGLKLGVPSPSSAPGVSAPVTPDDTVAPVAASATVNARLLTISFTEERRLDTVNVPPRSAFVVKAGVDTIDVTNVFVDGPNRKVSLELASAVGAGQTVTVSYTDPTTGDDDNAIQDEAGNDAASFTLTCTNTTVDRTGPKITKANVTGTSLVMTFTDATNLDATNLPPTSAFEVISDDVKITVSSVSVQSTAKTVTLTLATAVKVGAVVTVTYSDPLDTNDTNAIQDTVGNDAPGFIKFSVTNLTGDTVGPIIQSASVLYNLVTLTFDEKLDPAASVPTSAFTVTVDGVAATVQLVTIDGTNKAITLDLASQAAYDKAVRVSYSGLHIKDTSGNFAQTFSNRAVTNNTPYVPTYEYTPGGGGP